MAQARLQLTKVRDLSPRRVQYDMQLADLLEALGVPLNEIVPGERWTITIDGTDVSAIRHRQTTVNPV